ncbi:unnamed protein product [Cylindrotheca closterium]|uniref:MYND-type domain-containing protein n=1 Tax=Cylindrotheca closterium TaxID=2856 RepID=A0AAD2G385_9STRA|nr:unnamed protein product [Cylindrotheca closterium]
MPKTDPKACVICAKSSSLVCGKCKTMKYCSRDCQKQHWKLHKKTCGKPVFVDRNLEVGDKCTRCLETVEDDGHGNPVLMGCRVPHPEHLQQSCGSCYGGDGVTLALMCQACNYSYRRTGSGLSAKSETKITQGPKWCFEGFHTLLPAERLGDRRIKKDLVVITANDDMQEKIDALDGNEEVTVLRICSDGFYTEEYAPCLNIKLPNLIEFQLEDVSMKQIHLTPELTPKVKIISMQNPTQDDDPDFVIKCPELKDFTCHYWGFGNPDWVNTMLAHATKLESFDSYKLRVPYLKFASNELDNIRLHRAECLEYLELYAPRLTMLNVQAAYDLDVIKFVDTHPVLSKKLPKDFDFEEELEVNVENACLGEEAKHAIWLHPRFDGDEEDVGIEMGRVNISFRDGDVDDAIVTYDGSGDSKDASLYVPGDNPMLDFFHQLNERGRAGEFS